MKNSFSRMKNYPYLCILKQQQTPSTMNTLDIILTGISMALLAFLAMALVVIRQQDKAIKGFQDTHLKAMEENLARATKSLERIDYLKEKLDIARTLYRRELDQKFPRSTSIMVLWALFLCSFQLSAQWNVAPMGNVAWTTKDKHAPMDTIFTLRTDSTFLITAKEGDEVHSEVWRAERVDKWKHVGKKSKGVYDVEFSNHRMLVSSRKDPSMTYVYYASK